jgi:heptose I phosphotransferase
VTYLLTVLLLLAGGCLLLVARALRRACRPFVAWHPAQRAFLRGLGLVRPEQFLGLPAVVVSGHAGRRVSRVRLGQGDAAVTTYLKVEFRVAWVARLVNFLAGYGFVSRCVREAQTLQALHREGLGGPAWLAAGEDGRGRAFLLVRELAGATDLATLLGGLADPAGRLRLARRVGAALARIHDAGFEHRDLYAKHVLVDPDGGAVHLLDWQRARRRRSLDAGARARDLAALHATLADATPRERLACLLAYRRGVAGDCQVYFRIFLSLIEGRARHLLARRHVREKRRRPPAEAQAWLCLDGEALCVTPALHRLCPDASEWLALDRQPAAPGVALTRRWLSRAGAGWWLLVCRRAPRPLARLWRRWWGGVPDSPERRQARLLFRLERHGVAAPRLLAMGQRTGPGGQVESFLLTEPARDTVRLGPWLRRQSVRDGSERGELLRQLGVLLARLHEANCYLEDPEPALAVRLGGASPAAVLEGVEGVAVRRGGRAGRIRRDLGRLRRWLAEAGCGRADLRQFLAGYAGPEPAAAGPPVYRTAPPAPPRTDPQAASLPPVVEPLAVNCNSLWRRLVGGARRLRQRADWPLFAGADWADRIMGVEVTDRFHAKQGRSTGRWILHAPSDPARRLSVYLKRHYQLPRWQGLLATLFPGGDWSPAMQELRHLEWARRQGLPVPEVVAAGEFTGPLGRLQSFLAVEELAGMLPLHEAIPLAAARLDPATFRRWKRGLVAEMARLARQLHDRRCFHKDLYLCHFYIHADRVAGPPPGGFGPGAWRGHVYLIDLHRLTHHPWTWRLWQLKDLAQLLYSSEVAGVDVRDQIYFWRHYRGLGPRRKTDRLLRGCVLFKWRRYREHNLRRKARRRRDDG